MGFTLDRKELRKPTNTVVLSVGLLSKVLVTSGQPQSKSIKWRILEINTIWKF